MPETRYTSRQEVAVVESAIGLLREALGPDNPEALALLEQIELRIEDLESTLRRVDEWFRESEYVASGVRDRLGEPA